MDAGAEEDRRVVVSMRGIVALGRRPGLNMTGGWRTTFSIVGLPGSAFVENSIRTVTKTG